MSHMLFKKMAFFFDSFSVASVANQLFSMLTVLCSVALGPTRVIPNSVTSEKLFEILDCHSGLVP